MNRDLVVCIPTRDGKSETLTVATIYQVAFLLKRVPTFIVSRAGNIPRARNVCQDHLRDKYPGRKNAWALWLDSDILIPMGFAAAIAADIAEAERFKKNWMGNYRMADGQNVLMKERGLFGGEHYTDEELMALPHGADIPMGGLGLMYVNMPLDYMFRADRAGEDVYFFLENLDLKFGFAKNIGAGHDKESTLWGPRTWEG